MNAIGVSEYGPIENLQSKQLSKLQNPTGRQLLVQVKGISVNPIDIKVRDGTYDMRPITMSVQSHLRWTRTVFMSWAMMEPE